MTSETNSRGAGGAVRLLTRFRSVDDDAAKQIRGRLIAMAAQVNAEPGHRAYEVLAVDDDPHTVYVLESWASTQDAQRHADHVLEDGSVDRVLPLLSERLLTQTLTTLAASAAAGPED